MKTILLTFLSSILCCSFAAADLMFETELEEVKATIDDKVVYAYYKFENKGKEDVVITKLDSPCPWCLTAAVKGGIKSGEQGSERYVFKPGAKGVIRATFSSLGTFTGTVEKKVHLYVKGDADGSPSIKLTCRVVIPKLMTMTPARLRWEKNEVGQTKSAVIDIKTKKLIEAKTISTSSSDFDVKLVELVKGKKYRVDATPKKGASNTIGLCYVRTDSTHVKYAKLRIYLVIK